MVFDCGSDSCSSILPQLLSSILVSCLWSTVFKRIAFSPWIGVGVVLEQCTIVVVSTKFCQHGSNITRYFLSVKSIEITAVIGAVNIVSIVCSAYLSFNLGSVVKNCHD